MTVHKIRPWHLVLLGVILIIAAAVRWHKIDSASFWIDEFLSLEVSSGHGYEHRDFPQGVVFTPARGLTGIDADGSWQNVILSLRRTNHPPLYFCMLRVWETVLNSDSDFAIRSLSALFSLMAILLAFDAARLLHGPRTALFAAAVMALAAPQIQYAQEARAYAMLVALMLGCCDAIVRIEKLGASRRRLIALFLCTLAMLLTHYLAFAVLVALLAYAIIRLRGTGASWALAAAAIWMLAAWGPVMLEQVTQPRSNLSWMNEAARGSGPTTLSRLAMLPLRFFVTPGPTPPAAAYIGIVLFALPALMLKRRPDLLLWSLILWIGTFTIVAADLLHSTSALSIPRYTLPAAAAANLLVVAIADSLIPRRPYIAPGIDRPPARSRCPAPTNGTSPTSARSPASSTTIAARTRCWFSMPLLSSIGIPACWRWDCPITATSSRSPDASPDQSCQQQPGPTARKGSRRRRHLERDRSRQHPSRLP